MSQIGIPLPGSSDFPLVALSILIAISTSYAAFDLGARVTAARGSLRSVWLAGSAMVMGLGIWSMHFTGMLAFRLPVPVAYHWPTVLVSLVAAILGSAVAFWVVSRKKMDRVEGLIGGALMGLAIVGMHYIGMAAMRLSAVCQYSPLLVSVSILIAVIASFAAIVFTFDHREDFRGTTLAKLLSAGVMGGAISLAHYTGMFSSSFFSSNVLPNMSAAVGISSLGLGGIAIGTLAVQGAAILTSSIDRQFAIQAKELQTSERFRQIADTLRDALILAKSDFSKVLFVNRAYEEISGRTLDSFYADPHSWLEGVHPEDRERVQKSVQLLIGGQSIENLEYRVIRPDGAISWVRMRTNPILDDRGQRSRILVSIHEFTMRKKAEDAHRQIEEQYRTVVETATDAVVSIDENSQILFVNPATLKLFGYDSAELMGRPLMMLMPEFFRELHKTSLQRYLATGQRHINWQGVELMGLRKDGGEFPVEVSFGEVTRQGLRIFTGFIRDISERKRAEDRIRLIIETIPTMVWTLRADGAVDFVNQRWTDYTGISLEEAINDPISPVHPEDIQRVMENWRADLAAGKASEDEIRLRRADGEYRWFLIRTTPLRDERGIVVKWYGVSIDIEDRKRAERQSRELIDAIPHQIWSGPPNGTLDYCSKRWRAETGMELEELRGDGWQRILHPEDRDRVLKAWRESVMNGTPYEQEERHRGADGSYRWYLSRGVPLRDGEGRIVRWYGTNTDIQDRKQAEEELQRLSGQLLKSQDEERRRISRELHDSTGQNLVALATDLSQIRASIPSSSRELRELASRCQELANQCIREVRTLSYLMYPPLLDESGLPDAIRHFLDGFTKRSGIKAELEASPNFGRLREDVELDLFRIVQESLTNIHRHSGSPTAKIILDRRSDYVMVEVSDSGRGTSGTKPGTSRGMPFQVGVGISSMKERVKLIGGSLEIVSGTNGTTVRARVPEATEGHQKSSSADS